MSYRGRPSKGCESCRTRKVKCDEAKPVCGRCSKSGHQCSYRDQADLLFRNQTASAAQKAEESWRKRAKTNQRAGSDDSKSPLSDRPSSGSGRDSPPNQAVGESSSSALALHSLDIALDSLPSDLQQVAWERFKYDFVIQRTPGRDPSEPSDSLLGFLPDLYARMPEGSCLKYIIDANAYINLSARQQLPHAQLLAEERLGKGIKLLHKAISDKKEAATDEVLAAVYFMGFYENLASAKHDGTYLAHKEGANALLKLRSMEEFYKNPLSARLYELSYMQMLIGNLQSAKPPALPLQDMAAARQYMPNMHSTSGMYVIRLIYNETDLHAKWHKIKYGLNPPANRHALQDLLQEALDLDAQFQAWESTIPADWRYDREPNTPAARAKYDPRWAELILGGNGAPAEISTSSSLKRAWIWQFYRTSRIFVLRDLIEMLNWMLKLPEPDNSDAAQQGPADKPTRTALDNVTLICHHAFSTTHLVNVIEKSCCAVLGHFTVDIHGKSSDDPVGFRGYVSMWPLGVIDAILRMGLVPDSGPVQPAQHEQASASFGSSQFRNQPPPSPAMFRMPQQQMHPLYHNPATATPDSLDFPRLPPVSETIHPPTYTTAIQHDYTQAPQPLDPLLARSHVFDSSPLHPFELPSELPPLTFTAPQPGQMDVKARREWIHRVLWYMGTQMGIKKALAILSYERYIESSKQGAEALYGVTPESIAR